MTDLIGVETAIKVVEQALHEGADYRKRLRMIPAKREIRGHWIDTGSGEECSVCGEIQYGYDSYRNYCPNCGSRMEE